MKMFVWSEPYRVNYGSSCCVAIAETVEQAREIAAIGKLQSFFRFQQDTSMQGVVLGEPTRILDLPCAEWYEVSE